MTKAFHSQSMLQVMKDLADWGNQFPSSPLENHFGVAKITVEFPENYVSFQLMDDGVEITDLPIDPKESK